MKTVKCRYGTKLMHRKNDGATASADERSCATMCKQTPTCTADQVGADANANVRMQVKCTWSKSMMQSSVHL